MNLKIHIAGQVAKATFATYCLMPDGYTRQSASSAD